MTEEHIHLSQSLEEKIERLFPHYGFYPGGVDAYFVREVTWHWHNEFEFGYVADGRILYKTSRQEILLRQGEGIFINSGVLHFLQPVKSEKPARLYTQFVDSAFLAESGSSAEERYISPVLMKKTLDAFPIRREDGMALFLEGLEEGIQLAKGREPFYELRLRKIFLSLWEEVYARAAVPVPDEKAEEDGDQRVKEMILYMQQHFQEELTTAEIAHRAHISERECYRLFQNRLGMTPLELLFSIRMRQAQELLLHSDKSILEIALETGFNSSSYFGKRFKERYGISPGQIRKAYMPENIKAKGGISR